MRLNSDDGIDPGVKISRTPKNLSTDRRLLNFAREPLNRFGGDVFQKPAQGGRRAEALGVYYLLDLISFFRGGHWG